MFKSKLLKIILIIGALSIQNTNAQTKVVVIPLGSDVSAQQFNDLVEQMYRSRVYSGIVESDGDKGGRGHYTSVMVEEGVYDVTIYPPNGVSTDDGMLQAPSIVVTSRNVARIATVSLFDHVTTNIRFRVTLRAFDGTIANASFYFHVQFSETSQLDLD